jgi:osmotically-inducible protein OsmY
MRHYHILALILASSLQQACVPVIATGAAVGASTVHDHRSVGRVVDDQGAELKASDMLLKKTALDQQSHVNFISYNGAMLITGEALTEAVKQEIGALAKSIPNVDRVYNELVISANSNLRSRSRDTWITTKIKSKITAEKGLDPTRIKVVTERNVVYLMGLVTKNEAAKAVLLARRTKGVVKVIKLFEYH